MQAKPFSVELGVCAFTIRLTTRDGRCYMADNVADEASTDHGAGALSPLPSELRPEYHGYGFHSRHKARRAADWLNERAAERVR